MQLHTFIFSKLPYFDTHLAAENATETTARKEDKRRSSLKIKVKIFDFELAPAE